MRISLAVVVLATVGLSLVCGACGHSARNRVQDPWLLVWSLLHRNEGAIGFATPDIREMPDIWPRLGLEYFNGGVAVLRSSEGSLAPRHPLLFNDDGGFLCRAIRFMSVDVTGDGNRDLIAAAWHDPDVCFLFFDMTSRPVKAVTLGGLNRLSVGPSAFPVTHDFDADRRPEVICYSSTRLLHRDAGLDVEAMEKRGVNTVAAVWSLAVGKPRIVLAFDGTKILYEPPDDTNPTCLLINGEDIVWNPSAKCFEVPESAQGALLLNRALPRD
jgi:hypothetical protein